MTLYDAFTFAWELDILEIRLRELYDVVDTFILVEATHTHKGDEKPLHYAQNRPRFAAWNDKIRHVVVGDLPGGDGLPAIRRREMSQRNAILRGLLDASDDDTVLISDGDEIPRKSAVEILRNLHSGLPDGTIVTYLQKLYYYNVNTASERPWPGTRACKVADARALSPHVVRCGLGQPDPYYPQHATIQNAGWHYSYFGNMTHIQNKMQQFLHQELVTEENTAPEAIEAAVQAGRDPWGREQAERFTIGPAVDLPRAIACDPMRYQQFFHPDWRPEFHEDWYDAEQLAVVCHLARHAPAEGAIVEIGCWEGRSTVAIAQAVAPRTLVCVDHWRGNGDEKDGHPATRAASERDVAATFVRNMELLTPHNVCMDQADWRDWMSDRTELRIAFLHLDAAHDYDSVRDCLEAIKPFLVSGAILCGDDYYADGVRRGVQDALGGGVQDIGGRLWVWQKGA